MKKVPAMRPEEDAELPEEPEFRQGEPEYSEEDPDYEERGQSEVQDDAPEMRWMNDPQAEPTPGEGPGGAEEYGVTPAEQVEGEPLDQRLQRERTDGEGEPQRPRLEEEVEEEAAAPSERAGRLIEQDEGARTDTDKEAEADPATDIGRYSSEEEAVRVEEE